MKPFRIGVTGLALACGLVLAVPAVAENVEGTNGDDTLVGTGQNDDIFGKDGNDTLRGRGRLDLLIGGAGQDNIQGGSAFDEIRAGAGADTIRARDENRDQIDCGPGVDTAVVDRIEDGIINCENLEVAGPS